MPHADEGDQSNDLDLQKFRRDKMACSCVQTCSEHGVLGADVEIAIILVSLVVPGWGSQLRLVSDVGHSKQCSSSKLAVRSSDSGAISTS